MSPPRPTNRHLGVESAPALGRSTHALLADLDDGEGAEAFRRTCGSGVSTRTSWPRNPHIGHQLAGPQLRQAGSLPANRLRRRGLRALVPQNPPGPFVDAGMRRYWRAGWMHNRCAWWASFLVKDLLIPWWRGRNGSCVTWQTATSPATPRVGSGWPAAGTDAARIPRLQSGHAGLIRPPHGDYVRRFVPEPEGSGGAAVHGTWTLPSGAVPGYPGADSGPREARREAACAVRASAGEPRLR